MNSFGKLTFGAYVSAQYCVKNTQIFFIISGGGAPEMEVAVKLRQMAQTQHGAEQYCWRAFAEALEVVSLQVSRFIASKSQKNIKQ